MGVALQQSRPSRHTEIEIGKGIAVFLMICVHVLEVHADPVVHHSWFGKVIEFITCFPAAPLFMMAMGVGTVYSRRQDARYAFSRGAWLLATAYLLNAARLFIPLLLGLRLGFLTPDGILYDHVVLSLLEVDILHFAGLAFLLIGVLRAAKVPWTAYPVVGLALVTLNYAVRGIVTGEPITDTILGLFWGASVDTYFPLLSWAMYPLVGVAFGHLLKRTTDKRRFYLRTFIICSGVLLVALCVSDMGFLYYMGFPEEHSFAYYHQDLLGNAVNGSAALMWLSVVYFLSPALPARLTQRLLFWSKHLTTIYITHWVLVGWPVLFMGFSRLMYLETVLAMAVIVFAADRITAAYVRRTAGRRKPPAPAQAPAA